MHGGVVGPDTRGGMGAQSSIAVGATVGATMATPPTVVGPGAKVLEVARIMQATGTDAVAVADADGRPLGIVTVTDLVALLAA